MKNEIVLNLRQFPVLAHDRWDGQEKHITVTVAKSQLQAAQIVGQSSKELVERRVTGRATLCWRSASRPRWLLP